MNVNDYISSGIVESYVLGLADEAERAEFERMCAAHQDVRAARDNFELSLEKQARIGAVLPPPQLKNKLFAELAQSGFAQTGVARSGPGNTDIAGPGHVTGEPAQPRLTQSDGPGSVEVVNDHQPAPAKVVSGYNRVKYLAAASVVLLVGSTLLNFYLFRQYQEYSERYSSLLASQTELANNNRALQASVDNYQNTMALLRDPATSVIKMAGSKVPKNGSPDTSSVATIYWNRKSAEVYLLVNALPKPASNQQYQLWAIVDGKPVSAGVFDMNMADSILKMTNMPSAEAFAVTLEKSGGSETPQGAMYVYSAI